MLSTLQKRDWFGTTDTVLANAVSAAFSTAHFALASGPGDDVLTLSVPDGAKKDHDNYIFTVVFSRGGVRQSEAVESCPITKLTECTDQLILDVKSAAE